MHSVFSARMLAGTVTILSIFARSMAVMDAVERQYLQTVTGILDGILELVLGNFLRANHHVFLSVDYETPRRDGFILRSHTNSITPTISDSVS